MLPSQVLVRRSRRQATAAATAASARRNGAVTDDEIDTRKAPAEDINKARRRILRSSSSSSEDEDKKVRECSLKDYVTRNPGRSSSKLASPSSEGPATAAAAVAVDGCVASEPKAKADHIPENKCADKTIKSYRDALTRSSSSDESVSDISKKGPVQSVDFPAISGSFYKSGNHVTKNVPTANVSLPVLPKYPLENQVQSVNKSVTQASKINVQPKGLTQPKKSLPVPSASVLVLPKHPLENQVQSTNKSVTRPSKMTVQPKGILQPKNSLPVLEKRVSPSKFDMNKE